MARTNPGKATKLYEVSGIFQKAYSATARVQLAEKAFRVAGIEPNNPDIISEDCYSPSLVTLAALDNDCTVAPEEKEVSPSTSQMSVCSQLCHFLDMKNEELKGKENLKSEIMTSSPFKNLLEEKVELEEAKTNRALKKNKNWDKIKKKGKALKAKKNSF
ncbi:hypothetical protein AVEN_263679-1 [Araneus ventricosus]|uniref:Uncharacterized protein n=1 Tax=Araneus ventricosus TaxID=182803 RepID=A0A4Y2ARK1_ARAVE|nr:hypothetical protein AVEN_263679-1 [Araneus ventricosus]